MDSRHRIKRAKKWEKKRCAPVRPYVKLFGIVAKLPLKLLFKNECCGVHLVNVRLRCVLCVMLCVMLLIRLCRVLCEAVRGCVTLCEAVGVV